MVEIQSMKIWDLKNLQKGCLKFSVLSMYSKDENK